MNLAKPLLLVAAQFRHQAIELVKAHMGLRRQNRRDSAAAP